MNSKQRRIFIRNKMTPKEKKFWKEFELAQKNIPESLKTKLFVWKNNKLNLNVGERVTGTDIDAAWGNNYWTWEPQWKMQSF